MVRKVYQLLFIFICKLYICFCLERMLTRSKELTDKEYDRYKPGSTFRSSLFAKDFRCFLNVFVNVRPVSPPTKRLVPVGGLTINDSDCLEACITECLKFSSRLETSQPEMNAEFGSYSLSQARENLRVLDNASKINVSSDILSSTFQNSFFQSETSNFPLSSNTS